MSSAPFVKSQTSEHRQNDIEDESDEGMRKFLWWSFFALVVIFPAFGYFVGNAFFGVLFGVLGLLLFLMLEHMTH